MSKTLRASHPLVAVAALATLACLGCGLSAFAEDPPAAPGMAGGGEAEDPDDTDPDTPQQLLDAIGKAIDKGVAYLKQRQNPDGSWGLMEGSGKYDPSAKGDAYTCPAGPTALALYALLKCRVPADDPVVRKGFKFLREKQRTPGSAYETSMMILALTARADPYQKHADSERAGDKIQLTGEDRAWTQDLVRYLLKKREKAKVLGWRYMVEVPGRNVATLASGNQDLSSTQLAVLALFAADRCGIEVEGKVWNEVITFAMQQQEDDGPEWDRAVYDRPKGGASGAAPSPGGTAPDKGRYAPQPGETPVKDRARGFAYIKSDKLIADEGAPTGGMTACGVGTIVIARHVLMKRDDPLWLKRDRDAVQKSVYDGLAWLDANYDPFRNPRKQKENVYHVYYLYCCERAFDLIGNKLLGKHLWYQEMAQQLVNRQHAKGFWDSDSTHKPAEVLDTSFAVLFLRRATKGPGKPFSVTGSGDEPAVDKRGG